MKSQDINEHDVKLTQKRQTFEARLYSDDRCFIVAQGISRNK